MTWYAPSAHAGCVEGAGLVLTCAAIKTRTIRTTTTWYAPSTQTGCEERAGLVPGHDAPQHSLGHHPHRAVMHLCKGSGHLAVHRQQGLFPGPHRHFHTFRLDNSPRQMDRIKCDAGLTSTFPCLPPKCLSQTQSGSDVTLAQPWAARYNSWLLIKLMLKGVVFFPPFLSFLFFSCLFFSCLLFSSLMLA